MTRSMQDINRMLDRQGERLAASHPDREDAFDRKLSGLLPTGLVPTGPEPRKPGEHIADYVIRTNPELHARIMAGQEGYK